MQTTLKRDSHWTTTATTQLKDIRKTLPLPIPSILVGAKGLA